MTKNPRSVFTSIGFIVETIRTMPKIYANV